MKADIIEELYAITKTYEKVRQKAASLKGRKQEIQKRSEQKWGVMKIEDLKSIKKNLEKEMERNEQKIETLYEELKKAFHE